MMKLLANKRCALVKPTTLAALLLTTTAIAQTASAAEFVEGTGWFPRSGQKTYVAFSTECVGGQLQNKFQVQDAVLDLRLAKGNVTSMISNGSDSRTLTGDATIMLSSGETTSGTFRATVTDSTDAVAIELSSGHFVSSNLQRGDLAIRYYPSASCTNSGTDSTAPSVEMTAPTNATEVAGTIDFTATATDNSSGVAGVQFLVNGLPFGAEHTAEPYALTGLNTLQATNGAYILQAKVRDNAGNTARSNLIAITVKNNANPAPDITRPAATITSPGNGVTVSGSGTVQSSASDTGSGVAGVQFFIDGASVGSEDNTAPYQLSGDTSVLTNGPHLLMTRARDWAGNLANSPVVTMNVNNAGGANGGTIQRIEQTDAAVTYTGTWLNINDPRPSGGSVLESNQPGASATVAFNGTGITWVGFRCTCAAGTARVYLDNNYYAAVDSYSSTEEAQSAIYSIQGLANGPHTLKIEVTGKYHAEGETAYLIVDAFDVRHP